MGWSVLWEDAIRVEFLGRCRPGVGGWSGEWGIGHERAPPSRTYPGRIRGARASSHDAACARPPSDPRTRALVTSDSLVSRTLPKRRPSQSEQKEGHVASPFHRGTRSFRPRRDGHPDRQEDRRRGRRQQRRLLRPRRRRRRARRGPPHLFRGRSSPVRAPGADQSLPQRDRPGAPPGLPHLRRRRRRATEPGVVRRQRRRGPPRHPRGRMGPVRQDGHHRQIHIHRLRETHRRDRMHRAQAPGVHGRRPPGRPLRPRQRRRPLPLRRHGRRQSTRGHRRR